MSVVKMKSWRGVGWVLAFGVISYYVSNIVWIEHEILPLEDFVTTNGYPIEHHEVTTEDGYILTLFRIQNTLDTKKGPRPAVLFHHGAACDSYVWVALGSNRSLAFQLVDQGYDVWLANARGSHYSLKHTSENITYQQYWNHSWHEIGLYDLPVEIDYILNHTGQTMLSYIGHSMGGTVMAVLLSSKPEYNSKIQVYIGFSPGVYVKEVSSFTMWLFGTVISDMQIKYFGYGNWNSITKHFTEVHRKYCKPGYFYMPICKSMYTDLGETSQINEEELSRIFSVLMSSGSSKIIHHFGQIHLSEKFRQYDYGAEENKKIYGAEVPPEYDLQKITAPTFLYYSDTDGACYGQGVVQFGKSLPNATLYRVPVPQFNHLDFLYGKDLNEVLHPDIFRVLKENSQQKPIK